MKRITPDTTEGAANSRQLMFKIHVTFHVTHPEAQHKERCWWANNGVTVNVCEETTGIKTQIAKNTVEDFPE